MPRIRFRTHCMLSACHRTIGRCFVGSLFASTLLAGCVQQGPAPDEVPDVPPLDYTIAAEVPPGSISTVPAETVPPPVSAHEPVVPAHPAPVVTPATPTTAAVITPGSNPGVTSAAPVTPARPMSPQEQRIASLELTLLNMSNELAWLKSQPSSATTPWGTPSPKVVPEAPVTPPVVPGQTAPATGRTPVQANMEQMDRMATLERNIQSVQVELATLRNQPAQASPWGTTTPGAAQIQAEASATPPPAPVPMSERRPTQTVAVIPTMPAPPQTPAPATPPPAPVTPAPVTPAPVVNPDDMTQYPVTVPLAEVADKTIPPPSRDSIATPPLKSSRPARQTPPAATAPSGTAQRATPQTTTRPAAIQPAATPAPAQGELGLYQSAYNAYEAKRYNEAWNGFDAYLKAYPNGKYAANSLYWKGEVRYSLGDYAGAILLFKDVIARYPRHSKSPDALLKTAMSYNRLQDRDNAALHVRILNEDYPRSEAASRAKRLGL